jgi:hypothetical protein
MGAKRVIFGGVGREKRGQKGQYRVSKAVEMAAFLWVGGVVGGQGGILRPKSDSMPEMRRAPQVTFAVLPCVREMRKSLPSTYSATEV